MSERLTLNLAGAPDTPPEEVERTVKQLGYTVARREAGELEAGAVKGQDTKIRAFKLPADAPTSVLASGMEASIPEPIDRSWYRTPKGRLVLLTGGLLAVAWAAKLILPGEFTPWVFIAACLIGVAPVARRAFAALRAGMPFTIEMLMRSPPPERW